MEEQPWESPGGVYNEGIIGRIPQCPYGGPWEALASGSIARTADFADSHFVYILWTP